MNYDFSEAEFALFVKVQEAVQQMAKDRALEAGEPAQLKDNLNAGLAGLAATDYLGLGIAPDAGQGDLLTWTAAMEIAGAVSPSLMLAVEMSTRVFGRILSNWGSPAQKEKWLTPLLAGNLAGAVALSEDSLNVENEALKTEGQAGGGRIAVTGHKQYVVNGPTADCIAVAGQMNGRPAVFLIPGNAEGLTLAPPMTNLGYNGAAVCPLDLNGCSIPEDQVIVPDMDEKAMLGTLKHWENQVLLGAALGLLKSAFEAARDYAKTHKSGGKPVIAYQAVGFKLAEMLTLYQTSQLFAYRAAWTSGRDIREGESLTNCAKVFCMEATEQVAGMALQVMAGSGYAAGNPAERAYRYAKYLQIAGTSTEIARVKIGDEAMGVR